MLEEIESVTNDAIINIALDTVKKNKQMIVFVNIKKGAEATAEKIASKIKLSSEEQKIMQSISEESLKALGTPTKQCRRLSKILENGVAFHHSGLHSKQRELIETNFREGKIKVICATPTLAAGVDLPAFRVVIRDLKRYGGSWGMTDIPVLEYEQQAGRAGRPKYDKAGEAICIANSVEEKEKIWNQYILGEPEEILSKLAVEPILRTYILSLVATGYVSSVSGIKSFMSKTFYAHQYKDLGRLHSLLDKMISKLEEWEFISMESKQDEKEKTGKNKTGFVSASKIKNDSEIIATKLGQRVAELYLDPYTAHYLIVSMQNNSSEKETIEFPVLQMITWTLEMRPLVRTRKKDLERVEEYLTKFDEDFLCLKPDEYSEEYYEFLDSVNTAIVLDEWMNETNEDKIFEEHNVAPGELNAKLERAEWLLHSCYELSKIQGFREVGKAILKTKTRLKYGVKEELLPLLKLKGIGRIRARKLFSNGIRDLGDVKKAEVTILAQLIGKTIALDIKKQVGQDLDAEKVQVSPTKRKGQISLDKF